MTEYLHNQNILISSVDPLITKVCDFGLAKSMADERMAVRSSIVTVSQG